MKKKLIIIFMVCFVLLAGVFFYQKNNNKKISGTEMFTDEFVGSVTQIDFHPSGGRDTISIKDDKKIDEFFEILRVEEYKALDKSDWVEGFYSFDFITNDGNVVDFGHGCSVITFDKTPDSTQYEVVSGNDLVKGVIEEIIFSVK